MKDDRPIDHYDVEEIKQFIPHRYPFLMIDKVKDIVPGKQATGIKSVTINEPFFIGHFPDRAIMPGVLIIEAMAQTAAVCVMAMNADHLKNTTKENDIVYFTAIEQARFRHPVRPGDRLSILVERKQCRGDYWKFNSTACIDQDVIAAQAAFSAKVVKGDG